MRLRRAALTTLSASLTLLAVASTSASADWASNGTRALRVASHFPSVATDGRGGVFVATAPVSIHVSRLDDTGEIAPGWDSLGIRLARQPDYNTWTPVLVEDGVGGVYVLIHERECLVSCHPQEGSHLGLQHIDSSGRVVSGWPAEGLHLDSGLLKHSFNQPDTAYASIVPDGDGGVIVAWSAIRPGGAWESDIFAQRIGFDGAELWGHGGITVNALSGDQRYATVVADGVGGAFVYWIDQALPGAVRVVGQHVSASGRLMWHPEGVRVSTTALTRAHRPVCVSDGARGSIVAWAGQESTGLDVFAARVTRGGGRPWRNDLLVCGAPGDQREVKLVSSRGGVIAAWRDGRGAPSLGLYAQRVSRQGSAEWARDGIAITTTLDRNDFANSFAMILDRADGAIFGWMDTRPGFGIWVQRLDGAGRPAPGWATEGTAVCADLVGYRLTEDIFLVGDAGRDPVLAWCGEDHSCPAYCGQTVWAMRIGPDGPVTSPTSLTRLGLAGCVEVSPSRVGNAPGLSVRQIVAGRGDANVTLRLAVPGAAPALIEVFDVSGRRVWRREIALTAGEHDVPLGPLAGVARGLYFARVTQAGDAAVARVMLAR